MTITWLSVQPLDTVMVRDGRPFDAGSSGVARGVAPPPNTLGGVARAVLGRDVDRIVGPLVAIGEVMAFPAPADLVVDGPTTRRLAPVARAASSRDDLDERHRFSHLLHGDGEPLGAWLTGTGMRRWLDAEDDLVMHRLWLGGEHADTERHLGLIRTAAEHIPRDLLDAVGSRRAAAVDTLALPSRQVTITPMWRLVVGTARARRWRAA